MNPHPPCLVLDDLLLACPIDGVPSELLCALDPAPAPCNGLRAHRGWGYATAQQLDAAGITPARACTELASALAVAVTAHAALPETTRGRLAWPTEAENLTTDRWLAAFAAGPEPWLLTMAGGLDPMTLLRCGLLATPGARVELWLPAELTQRGRGLTRHVAGRN